MPLTGTGLTQSEALALIAAGVQAPSADNCHFVCFDLLPQAITVRIKSRLGKGVPVHRLAMYEFSFGSIIENITLKAAALGKRCVPIPNTRWQQDGIVATLQLFQDQATTLYDPLVEFIFARHTNRRLYQKRRIERSILQDISAQAAKTSHAKIVWLEDNAARREALALIRLAEAERFRRRALHAELFGAVRFEDGWAAMSQEGLSPGSLEIESYARPLFRAIAHWPLQRALNAVGAATLLGRRAGWLPASTAPHLGLMTVSEETSMRWLFAGRAFQRFWLGATQHGLSLQPMAATVALSNQMAAPDWVRPHVQTRLRAGLARLSESAQPAMMFRLGYADPPSVKSGRRSAETYVARSQLSHQARNGS